MKIELIKTTKLNGDVYYSVTKDGEHVEGSVSMNLEAANEIYQKVVNKEMTKTETIKSTEIK